ncbi:MAG: branched-chain amino acid transport system II carrier protein [Verrucomicrobia bacterium]|nr:branched-chain amino acid transport system II carrier protein [Verrucomicrobiota bacterium]
MSSLFFSALSCGLIFLFTIRRNHILTLLGWVLTPLLLVSLLTIIIIGLLVEPNIQTVTQSDSTLFFHGLKEGYNTMDLLAAFFFSSTILNILRIRLQENSLTSHTYIRTAFKASWIGAFLLALIYIGFSYLAAFHGSHFLTQSKEDLLSSITMKIAGPYAGSLVCITIALACLTTAIALISAFTDFIYKELFKEKIRYEILLLGSLLLTFFVSTFEFTGISAFLGPILQICYPGLIVLTILNIIHRLKNFRPIKVPVFFAFAVSTYFYFQS